MKVQELQDIKQRYKIVGNCDGLNHALDVALQVAPTDLSVLIVGESGVGKEIIPRVIHDQSPRRRGKYFAINCGSIPEGTIDSELFGHVKGSFTGAIGDSPGYFGAADKGTLFLDEVGELPLATQARLLRVLETGEYLPVGATEVRKTDVRVVAATNVNMMKAISEGRFREDLYYRLNSIPIHMPALRERGEDIPLLFRFFAMQMAEKYKMDKVVLRDGAKEMLMKYKWPGNIRQLKNITEQISILSQQREITPDILSQFIPQDVETTQLAKTGSYSNESEHSFENEREILYKILYELRGSVAELRQEVAMLKKKLGGDKVNELQPTRSVPATPAFLPRHEAEDAEAEEYVEPERVFDDQKRYINERIVNEHKGMTTVSEMRKTEDIYPEKTDIRADETKEVLNLDVVEKQMLMKALDRNNGNRKKAAEDLGYSDRTLYRRLKQYGLEKY
ncbi:MAG: sigma-54 dependent transcriptional regulator [Prevotella sp.]|nr:sigma-54 dependent transcriptional regulator [Prevotella sp.]